MRKAAITTGAMAVITVIADRAVPPPDHNRSIHRHAKRFTPIAMQRGPLAQRLSIAAIQVMAAISIATAMGSVAKTQQVVRSRQGRLSLRGPP